MSDKYAPKITRQQWADFAEKHGMGMNEFVGELAVATLQMATHLQNKLPPSARKKNTPLAGHAQHQLVLRIRD